MQALQRLTARDKLMHALGGVILFAAFAIVLTPLYAALAVSAVGALKELHDYRNPQKHSVELLDFLMTTAGGLLGLACYLLGVIHG